MFLFLSREQSLVAIEIISLQLKFPQSMPSCVNFNGVTDREISVITPCVVFSFRTFDIKPKHNAFKKVYAILAVVKQRDSGGRHFGHSLTVECLSPYQCLKELENFV